MTKIIQQKKTLLIAETARNEMIAETAETNLKAIQEAPDSKNTREFVMLWETQLGLAKQRITLLKSGNFDQIINVKTTDINGSSYYLFSEIRKQFFNWEKKNKQTKYDVIPDLEDVQELPDNPLLLAVLTGIETVNPQLAKDIAEGKNKKWNRIISKYVKTT